MAETLTSAELAQLIRRVFSPTPADRGLALIVDVPDARLPDNEAWAQRRRLAAGWYDGLAAARAELGLEHVTLAWYRNAGSNNADLPATCWPHDARTGRAAAADVPDDADCLEGRPALAMGDLLRDHTIIIAPTELSTTAPLKVAARAGGFRAATMPGFLPGMIPALRLDYQEISRRVDLLKTWLDAAESAELSFEADGEPCLLTLDLRHREGHASGGLFPRNGVAGNLPSGEAYIVPYEGERPGDPSGSRGLLPVQIGDELVMFAVENNRARVVSDGPESRREAAHLAAEPAYANLAELGLGVLGDFGVEPCGSILLDEKLGLHVAFGRSDHFGGAVGPKDFSSPEAVIHLDRVYIPATQPRVRVREVRLRGPGLDRAVIVDDKFTAL
jgi:leucyl aminopeptidase (aminopeptidase T)